MSEPYDPAPNRPREHQFDGIVEFDNDPPRWLSATFLLSVVFAVFYLLTWHLSTTARLGPEQWQADMQALAELRAARDTGPLDEAGMRALLGSPERSAQGLALFARHQCANCHGGDATGAATGPNLRDRWWLHGNRMEDIATVIRAGANENKMPAHQGRMSNQDIGNLTIWPVALNRQGERAGKAPDLQREQDTPIGY